MRGKERGRRREQSLCLSGKGFLPSTAHTIRTTSRRSTLLPGTSILGGVQAVQISFQVDFTEGEDVCLLKHAQSRLVLEGQLPCHVRSIARGRTGTSYFFPQSSLTKGKSLCQFHNAHIGNFLKVDDLEKCICCAGGEMTPMDGLSAVVIDTRKALCFPQHAQSEKRSNEVEQHCKTWNVSMAQLCRTDHFSTEAETQWISKNLESVLKVN